MARPQKPPSERRTEYLHLRLSPTELSAIERYAAEAGVTVAEYVRATAMKTPPRKRPARERTLAMLQYELNSIATNLAQLEAATGETNFGAWAKFVGKDLIERTTDRTDLTALIESHHARINGVGVAVNAMARRANQGKDIDPDEVNETLILLKDVLEPLRLKLKEPPRERDEPERDDGPDPKDQRTVDLMHDSDLPPQIRDEAAVRAADEADMEFRYWNQIEATYRSRQGAVRYAEHRERAMAKQEARDQSWLDRRDRSFMEGLATVYKDATKARAKWDELEKTLGIGEAEEAVKKDPFLLGAVRGIRTGNVRTPEREKARRTFRYLVERRQKLRDSKRRVELIRGEIEIAQRRTRQAVRDFEMIQKIAGTSKELQAKLMARIKARARALDRVTEKALKRSSLAEDRKEQLNKAYKQHRERQRELERARERDRELGFDL